MNITRFYSPEWLYGFLLLLPLAWMMLRQRHRSTLMFSSLDLVKNLPHPLSSKLRECIPWLRLIGLALVLVALARPQQGIEGFREQREGVSIQICLDRSASMSAKDFLLNQKPISRLEAVKLAIRKFVDGDPELDLDGRGDDQIGLIAFGGYAEATCPATLDHDVLLSILDDTELPRPYTNIKGTTSAAYELYTVERATAVGDAMGMAIDQLNASGAKSRTIILLSDGESNSGVISPGQAIEIAKMFGVRVYCIGVGSTGRHFLHTYDTFGQEIIEPKDLRVDEATLVKIANQTGGKYFRAQDTASLVDVYREIDTLEKTPTEETVYREYRELFRPWLFGGLFLVVLEIVLSSTLFRTFP